MPTSSSHLRRPHHWEYLHWNRIARRPPHLPLPDPTTPWEEARRTSLCKKYKHEFDQHEHVLAVFVPFEKFTMTGTCQRIAVGMRQSDSRRAEGGLGAGSCAFSDEANERQVPSSATTEAIVGDMMCRDIQNQSKRSQFGQ